MKKRLLALIAVIGAAAAVAVRRVQKQQAERELWREATDDLQAGPPAPVS